MGTESTGYAGSPSHAVPRRVNDCVDAVYVLTVRSFAERIAHSQSEMARHGIRFEFMLQHDADQLDEATLAATFGPSDMKRAHQSLVLKHVQAWRDALARGYERILVFEDDAVLAPDFARRFDQAMAAAQQLPPGWLVFLGGVDTKVPEHYFLSEGPLVELPIATTEAYACDRESMLRRVQWLQQHRVTLAADHLIRRMDRELGVRQYWLRHPVVEQGSVLGLFGSVLDGSRNRHGALYNTLRNRWNKLQRRHLREWLVRAKARLGLLPRA